MNPIIITSYNTVVIKKHPKMPSYSVLAHKMRQGIMEMEDAAIFAILDDIAKSGNV